MNRILDVASSLAATLVRIPAGLSVGTLGKRPQQPLQLYEFEGCPFCRKVREALSMLDLEVDVFPCPKGGERFRREVMRMGGKAQFPYLVDPNTGKSMYESDEIVRYLFSKYGDGSVPWVLNLGPLTTASAGLGTVRVACVAPAMALPLRFHWYERLGPVASTRSVTGVPAGCVTDCGCTVITEAVMISRTGMSCDDLPCRITLRA